MRKKTLNELHAVYEGIKGLWSDDIDKQFETTTVIKDLLLSDERDDQIEELIKAGVLHKMVKFLQSHDHPKLQIEAARVLENIASGKHTQMVVSHQGVISSFVGFLSSANDDASNQAILVLGRISSVSSNNRDRVLAAGALSPLLARFSKIPELTMMQNAMKTLSELCTSRGTHTKFDVIGTLGLLVQYIDCEVDEEILYYASRALYHLLEVEDKNGKRDRIKILIDAGICPQLVKLVLNPSFRVVIATLNTVGYITELDDAQRQVLLRVKNGDLLLHLNQLINANLNEDISKKVCWVVSNFTFGNRLQIQAIIKSGIIVRLVYQLKHSYIEIQREAAWAISRTTERESKQKMRLVTRYLVDEGCIEVFCEMLSSPEAEIVLYCLKIIGHILKAGVVKANLRKKDDGTNPFAKKIKECGGFDKIKTLSSDGPNPEVGVEATLIKLNYFPDC